jgi:hypothetical protein
MIIYCTGDKTGDPSHKKFYKDLIDFSESLGLTVLAEFSHKFASTILLTDKQIYKRNLKWIDGSRLILAEVSGPCLDVGFEIAYAIYQGKIPVLAVHRSEVKVPAMLSGCDSTLLTIQKYNDPEEMQRIIKTFIKNIDNS